MDFFPRKTKYRNVCERRLQLTWMPNDSPPNLNFPLMEVSLPGPRTSPGSVRRFPSYLLISLAAWLEMRWRWVWQSWQVSLPFTRLATATANQLSFFLDSFLPRTTCSWDEVGFHWTLLMFGHSIRYKFSWGPTIKIYKKEIIVHL